MPIFDASTLARFFNEGEIEISQERPFIVDRYSLNIEVGIPLYTLPDYVLSIRRVTYLGMGLDPLPRRNEREVFQGGTQQSQPFWYIYNNVGLNQIKLFPIPNNVIPSVTGDLWSKDAIENGCIVEFYRSSDNVDFTIPDVLRPQLLKLFSAYKAFGVEGPSQNIKLSQYFIQRWEQQKQEFSELLNTLYNQPRRLVINDFATFNWFPGSPVLPIDRFGIYVDDGE